MHEWDATLARWVATVKGRGKTKAASMAVMRLNGRTNSIVMVHLTL
jgi:hypothetical protein